METQFYVYDLISLKYISNYFANSKSLPNSTDIKPDNDFCLWDNTNNIWVDVRNNEEIIQDRIKEEKEKQLKRKYDGIDAIAALTAEYKVMVQLGYVTEEENRISTETLLPISNLILLGEWIFAKDKLIEIGNTIIGENLYNKMITILDEYILINY